MTIEERNKILNIITNNCRQCPNVMCCPEKHCVLFRIEEAVENMMDKNAEIVQRKKNK